VGPDSVPQWTLQMTQAGQRASRYRAYALESLGGETVVEPR
jgi:hypothetical protein